MANEKTVEERVRKWVLDNIVLSEHCEIEYHDVEDALIKILKEQDKITRHACADEIERIDLMMFGNALCDVTPLKDKAVSICINTKAQ